LLICLALWRVKRRWMAALPGALLAVAGLIIAWRIDLNDVEWFGVREGLLLSSLAQLWLAALAVAVAAGVGNRAA